MHSDRHNDKKIGNRGILECSGYFSQILITWSWSSGQCAYSSCFLVGNFPLFRACPFWVRDLFPLIRLTLKQEVTFPFSGRWTLPGPCFGSVHFYFRWAIWEIVNKQFLTPSVWQNKATSSCDCQSKYTIHASQEFCYNQLNKLPRNSPETDGLFSERSSVSDMWCFKRWNARRWDQFRVSALERWQNSMPSHGQEPNFQENSWFVDWLLIVLRYFFPVNFLQNQFYQPYRTF